MGIQADIGITLVVGQNDHDVRPRRVGTGDPATAERQDHGYRQQAPENDHGLLLWKWRNIDLLLYGFFIMIISVYRPDGVIGILKSTRTQSFLAYIGLKSLPFVQEKSTKFLQK